jgi:hypothetical protein
MPASGSSSGEIVERRPMKTCPRCGKVNPAIALMCECGQSFGHDATLAATVTSGSPHTAADVWQQPPRVAVPFVANTRGGDSDAHDCAEQLTKLIRTYERAGYRFCHMENIQTVHANGCLAALMGNPTTVVRHQVAIFEYHGRQNGP